MNTQTAITNHKFLTEYPVPQVILRLSIPTVISMLATSVYNMADTYFVGQIGTHATVAVGLSFTIMTLLQAIGFFLGQGTGNFIAIKLGAKDSNSSEVMASTGMLLSLILGIMIICLGLVFLKSICTFLGGNDESLPFMVDYLSMIILSSPFMISSLMLGLQIRMQGMAKYSMIGIISGMALNILLDPLFIFTLGLGIKGAGVATLISQMTSFCLLLWICRCKEIIFPDITKANLSITKIKDIAAGGFPSLLRQGLGCVVVLTMNVCAAEYGENVIAAMTIVTRITFLILSVITGLGQGFQPLCGFSYGAGLFPRIYEGFKFTVKIATYILVIVGICTYIYAPEILSIFTSDIDAIATGAKALKWQALSFPLQGVVIVGSILLQTINKTLIASFMTAAKKGLFLIPLIIVLPSFIGVGGIVISQALSDILTFVIALPMLFKVLSDLSAKRKLKFA